MFFPGYSSNLAWASAPVILAEGCSDRCSRDQDRKNSLSVSEQHALCHNEKSDFSYEILIDCTMDGVLSYENVKPKIIVHLATTSRRAQQ